MWPFKPNDWEPVFVAEPDSYIAYRTIEGVRLTSTEHEVSITHTLYYSKSRDKYRIDFSGYPVSYKDTCPSYIACVKKQIELSNNKK